MPIDLSKWKQRAAAQKVEAALRKVKPDKTGEKLRRKFSRSAQKALESLTSGTRNPWLKVGNNGEIVVTAKLGRSIVPINGDPATAWPPAEAEDYIRDLKTAADEGQLDNDLIAAQNGANDVPPRRRRASKAK